MLALVDEAAHRQLRPQLPADYAGKMQRVFSQGGRMVLAALLGAALGPLSFSSGARLGGAQLLHPTEALLTLALVWAVLMPVMVKLATHFDGVSVTERAHA